MAFEEVQGQNSGEMEEREFIPAKIGTEFEGTFVRMSNEKPSKFGGMLRYVSVDLTDGRKVIVTASRILKERLESAGLVPGDRIKVVVESAVSKAGNTYALPRVYVDRTGSAGVEASETSASAPVTKSAVADDTPPF